MKTRSSLFNLFGLLTTLVAAVALTSCDSGTLPQGPGDPGSDGDGDDGSAQPSVIMASLVASDGSEPEDGEGASVPLSGMATLSGLQIELWNGETWLVVSEGSTEAEIAVAKKTAMVTLMPAQEIPAGDYTKCRLTATDAMISVSATFQGREYAAELAAESEDPVVVEKDVTVTENADGSRTLAIDLRMVRRIDLELQGASVRLVASGDLGSFSASF